MKEIRPKPALNARVRGPGSKSLTHRALIAAGLADGESLLLDPLSCEDTLYTLNGLRAVGVKATWDGDRLRVLGTGGRFVQRPGTKRIFVGNSGTSFRLLLSAVALAKGHYLLTGTARMQDRPVGGLVEALSTLGVAVTSTHRPGFPPVSIEADGIRGGRVVVRGDVSSQYISSLLLASPYARRGVEIEIEGALVSGPYIDLTCETMERFGVHVEREGYASFRVPGGQTYVPRRFPVESDVSSASYFWAAAAVTGGTVSTENIDPFTTKQGDIGLLTILEGMGCAVERNPDGVVVHGGPLSGVDVDMRTMPDMVPTLAAVALFAKGKTIIRNVSHLRHKESDRLGAVAAEWSRLGAHVEERADGLVVHGQGPLSGTIVDAHEDHRIAMSLAVIGLNVPGIIIREAACVSKSFPEFWTLWETL